LRDENIHAFYTSPLARARDTAIVIARHHDLAVLRTRALAAVEEVVQRSSRKIATGPALIHGLHKSGDKVIISPGDYASCWKC
jgi:hypothetical protein